jgi:hypothetical protein
MTLAVKFYYEEYTNMSYTSKVKLFMGVVSVEFKNNKGEVVTFTCKAP